jgi:uncharacterized protein YaaR (DUF327 family)
MSSTTSTLKRAASDSVELDNKVVHKTARKEEVADAVEFVSVLNEEQQKHFDEEITHLVHAVYDNYETCDMFDECVKMSHAEALFNKNKKSMKNDVKYAIEVAVEEKKNTTPCHEKVNRDLMCYAVSNAVIDFVELDIFKNVHNSFLAAEIVREKADILAITLVEKMTIALSDFEEGDDDDEDEDGNE